MAIGISERLEELMELRTPVIDAGGTTIHKKRLDESMREGVQVFLIHGL